MLHITEINPFAQFFRYLKDVPINKESCIIIHADPRDDQRTHNAPTASQVAGIWLEEETSFSSSLQRHIVVRPLSGGSHRILHYYECYDPL